MNRLLLAAIVTAVGLSACSKKEEAAPANSTAAPATAPNALPPVYSATPNSGKVLQVIPAGSYTYIEVETGGQNVWIAGGPIQIKAGDTLQWGDYAVMNNFNSKALNRTFEQILFVQTWGPAGGATSQMAPHGNTAGQPAAQMPAGHPPAVSAAPAAPGGQAAGSALTTGQGEVKSLANAGGYTYLEVKQNGGTVWIAAPETASVKVGDKVSWNGGMVMNNFNAKSLGRTFDQIVFAGGVSAAK